MPGPEPPPGGYSGILLVDKPAGWTSHDVVAKARRICGQRRIGHTGTLDPMATGLLVLCLGRATRLVEYLTGHDKEYAGEVVLGRVTTTDDAEGDIIEYRPVPALDSATLSALEAEFTGPLMQVPPAYSAIKVAGRRAYAVARGGGELALPARPVTIHDLHLEQLTEDRLALRVKCGPGTYVRSLARDIGARLGCGGHLAALRRLRAGAFAVDEGVSLDRLEQLAAERRISDLLLAPDEGLRSVPAALLATPRARLLAQGSILAGAGSAMAEPLLRVYDSDGRFIGMGRVGDDGALQPAKMLVRPEELDFMSNTDTYQD